MTLLLNVCRYHAAKHQATKRMNDKPLQASHHLTCAALAGEITIIAILQKKKCFDLKGRCLCDPLIKLSLLHITYSLLLFISHFVIDCHNQAMYTCIVCLCMAHTYLLYAVCVLWLCDFGLECCSTVSVCLSFVCR